MPSLRSRLFVFILKYRHLLKFQLKRKNVIDENTSIIKLREEVERGAEFFGKLPHEFKLEPLKIGNVDAEWMIPPGTGKDKVILYFHGGGLVLGSIKAHRGIVAKFVKGSGVPALLFDYALAPEHPYPQALTDSITVYKYLLDEGIPPSKIIFGGDSGGGCLVFAAMLTLKEKKIPLPAAAFALSPWTDLTNSGESWDKNAELDTLTWKDAQTIFSKYYAGDNNPEHPMISPLFGDLTGLPPLLIFAGSDELMRDDSVRLADKAEQAKVDVTLIIGDRLFHCYPACAPLFPEAVDAMAKIADFIIKHIE